MEGRNTDLYPGLAAISFLIHFYSELIFTGTQPQDCVRLTMANIRSLCVLIKCTT